MRIDSHHIAFVSGGNDSVALIQYLKESGYTNVSAAYSDTQWSSGWWPLRIEKFKQFCLDAGYSFYEIPSEGMEALIFRKKGFPANKPKFCTYELKIAPAKAWLDEIDPQRDAVCCVGVRREESAARRSWPLWIEESENHGGRSLYSPLAPITEDQRNKLLYRAGYRPLPHRSKECSPCVNANRADFRALDEQDIMKVERLEKLTGRFMFRVQRFMGARGIREVIWWAWSDRGKFEPQSDGCDSGMCSS